MTQPIAAEPAVPLPLLQATSPRTGMPPEISAQPGTHRRRRSSASPAPPPTLVWPTDDGHEAAQVRLVRPGMKHSQSQAISLMLGALVPGDKVRFASLLAELAAFCSDVEAWQLMEVLLQFPAESWLKTLRWCRRIDLRNAPPAALASHLKAVSCVSASERSGLWHLAQRCLGPEAPLECQLRLFAGLSALPVADYAAFAALCAPLRTQDWVLPAALADACIAAAQLWRTAEPHPWTTAVAARVPAPTVLATILPQPLQARCAPQLAYDLENVMSTDRLQACGQSIAQLMARVRRPWPIAPALFIIKQYIKNLRTAPDAAGGTLRKPRMIGRDSRTQAVTWHHNTELTNALLTLSGPLAASDLGPCIEANVLLSVAGGPAVGTAALCVCLWQDIASDASEGGGDGGALSQKDLANLRYSFVKALAQCVEDDGHRVCAPGICMRLMACLPGAPLREFVTPQALFTELARAFTQDLGEAQGPSQAALQIFRDYAIASAASVFDLDPAARCTFIQHLDSYLAYNYGWTPS